MTIGSIQIQPRLIQVVSLAWEAAPATPVVSSTLKTPATGGLLQSPVPTRGIVDWADTTTMSTITAALDSTAFQLVASGIRYLNLSDAVVLC